MVSECVSVHAPIKNYLAQSNFCTEAVARVPACVMYAHVHVVRTMLSYNPCVCCVCMCSECQLLSPVCCVHVLEDWVLHVEVI